MSLRSKTAMSSSRTVKKKTVGTVSVRSRTSVHLFELDPNSGPVDVPQTVVLYGEGIDPARVKAKFGTQASVFLKVLTTVSTNYYLFVQRYLTPIC